MADRIITVRGTGNVSVKPDLTIIEMNLDVTETDYGAALERATSELDVLRAALVSVGHDSKALKTSSFNVNTKYENYKQNDEWKKRFVGYNCAHGLRLEFDFDMPTLGKALCAIAECKADPQFNIKFTVKDPAAVNQQLLESAVTNATEKAKILAKAAGVKLGEIKQIDYSWGELRLYSESDLTVCRDIASKVSSIEIEPDDIDASDNVTIVWSIE
jgi:uncharacterized protein YggE